MPRIVPILPCHGPNNDVRLNGPKSKPLSQSLLRASPTPREVLADRWLNSPSRQGASAPLLLACWVVCYGRKAGCTKGAYGSGIINTIS